MFDLRLRDPYYNPQNSCYDKYMNRLHIKDIDEDEIIMLDVDTEMIKDPHDLFNDNFEIKCDFRVNLKGYKNNRPSWIQ